MLKIRKKESGITLIALVITIVILIILAGVGMTLSLGDNGIFSKAQIASERTKYATAKEEISLKIIETITEKASKGEECKLSDIAIKMKKAENITIEKYYNSDIGLIKEGIIENLDTLKGIVVSSNKYSKYKFLIGKSCKIEGVLGKMTDETEMTEFIEINEFEKNIFGGKVVIDDDKENEIEQDAKKYIYINGDVSKEAGKFIGVNDKNSEYTINENNLYTNVLRGGGFNLAYIGTENKIDLTQYSKIMCEVTTGDNAPNSSNIFYLTLNTDQLPLKCDLPYFSKLSQSAGTNKEKYILEYKIPEECRNANYHIGFAASIKDVYVYKIWLENKKDFIKRILHNKNIESSSLNRGMSSI